MLPSLLRIQRPRDESSVPRTGLLVGLGVALLFACRYDDGKEEDDNQFREDVIWCEDAVARLARCCPDFDPGKIDCSYFYSFESGCGDSTTRLVEPAFTKDESVCIRETACDALVERGICVRARENGAARTTQTTTPSSSSSGTTSGNTTVTSNRTGPVCP